MSGGSSAASSMDLEAPEMDRESALRFRRAAARLHYLAQDRPDLADASGVLARSMRGRGMGVRFSSSSCCATSRPIPHAELDSAPSRRPRS